MEALKKFSTWGRVLPKFTNSQSPLYFHLLLNHFLTFYHAMHVVLARYCYRMSSVRPSVCLSVRPSVCNVAVSWAHRLD